MHKTQLKSKCKAILNHTALGEPVKNDEKDFLISVFENHPDWELKKGAGVENIFIRNTQYRNKCFYLKRIDGSSTDISYLHSIDRYTELHFIKKACREAIRPIIRDFIQTLDMNNLVCPITHKLLEIGDMHIDHYDLTFNELVEKWLAITEQDLTVNGTKDNDLVTCFQKLNTIKEFKTFHNENTHLRAVSREANLSILRNNP